MPHRHWVQGCRDEAGGPGEAAHQYQLKAGQGQYWLKSHRRVTGIFLHVFLVFDLVLIAHVKVAWNISCRTEAGLLVFTLHPSPRLASQTLYPNRDSPGQQFGHFLTFPPPHLTASLQLLVPPNSQHPPIATPKLRALGLNPEPGPSSPAHLGGMGKEKTTLKPPPPKSLFLAPWEEAACLPAAKPLSLFFLLLFTFFPVALSKKNPTPQLGGRGRS